MIPVAEPLLNEADIGAALDCLRSGWISSAGSWLDRFEADWASYCGRKYGVAVSNGTVALECAVAALRLPAGAEVILPSFTIISCVAAILRNGLVPVLVDSDPLTWGMDTSRIEAKITPRTAAIMVVHIYGHPADMDPVLALAEKRGLAVIEDAAEVHGAGYLSGRDTPSPKWKVCGSMGTASTFSFYANKLVTTGEGGMVVTDDAEIAARCRSLRNLCFVPQQRFLHRELGANWRLTNLQAALGVTQIARMDAIIARKREIARLYAEAFRDQPHVQLPIEAPWARNVYWVYGLVLDETFPQDAAGVMARLKETGIETRPFFLGMHEQPVLQEQGFFSGESYPVAERLARRGFYIPSGPGLRSEQIAEVAQQVRAALLLP